MICMKKAMLALALALAMVACATVVVDSSDGVTVDGISYSEGTGTTVAVDGYVGTDAVVVIPEQVTINGITYTVNEIRGNAFRTSTNITEVVIPATVEKIGNNAFSGCTNLRYVTIEGKVELGSGVFNSCQNLVLIDFKDNPTSIMEGALSLDSLDTCSYRAPEQIEEEQYEGISVLEYIPFNKKIIRFEPTGKVPDTAEGLTFITLEAGQKISLPDGAEKYGYDLKILNGDQTLDLEKFTVGEEDLKLTLQYTYTLFTVEFKVDDKVYDTQELPYESVIVPPEKDPTKEEDAQYIYTFKEWEGYTSEMKVEKDIVFNAVFDTELQKYTIEFMVDGKIVKSQVLEYGTLIELPEDPDDKTVEGIDYIFHHWNPYISGMTVTGDVTFTAQFVESDHEYTIKFVVDGQTVKTEKLHYKDEITAPEDPVKEDANGIRYTFTGWEGYNPGMTVTDDATFNAVFLESPVDDGSGSTWIIIVVVVIVVILLALVFLRKFL